MKPIGPLMKEHRRIEKMIDLLEEEVGLIEKRKGIDNGFLEDVVDFFRSYADRTHHGKEEDILFAELREKDLSDEHEEILGELLREHEKAREKISGLDSARQNFLDGHGRSIETIIDILGELTSLYRSHIEKEDERFFRPVMEYFGDGEQQEMLAKFEDFDREMIHEHFENIIDRNSDRKE